MAGPGGRRRPQDTGEDQFIASVLSFLNWAQKNARILVLGGAAVAIGVAGVLYYVDYRQRVSEIASAEIQALRFQMRQDPGEETIEELRSFLSQFADTRYGTEARVLLAHALLLQGRARDAVEPARRAARELGEDPMATRAAFLLAAAYEESADTASAVSVYERIGDAAERRGQRAEGLEAAARLRTALGDTARARELYQRLIELTPEDDPQRQVYQMRMAELDAQVVGTAGGRANGSQGGSQGGG